MFSGDFRGNTITPPLEGIFAFSENDIWFVGSLPIHWDGEKYKIFDVRSTTNPNLSLWNAWGTDSNDIYFIGLNGSIARYKDGNWSNLSINTDLTIYNIWGDLNERTDNYEIFAVASKIAQSLDKKILRILDNTIQEVNADSIPSSSTGFTPLEAQEAFYMVKRTNESNSVRIIGYGQDDGVFNFAAISYGGFFGLRKLL